MIHNITKWLFAILFIITVLNGEMYGQSENPDALYFKNGSILRGKIIHLMPGDTISFSINGSQPILFDYESVKKIKMGVDKEVSIYNFKEKGWYFRSQFSVLYQKELGGFSLSQSVGYHFKHWLSAGVGIGIDNYYGEPGNNLYPLFVEIRSYLQQKNVTPYLALRSGYSMIKADPEFGQIGAKGDIFLNPLFGYRLGRGRPFIDLFVGMKFQSAEYHTRSSQSQSITNIDFRRYDFGIGLTF